MSAAAPEPISPELALVCPELRMAAIEALPDVEWQSFVAQIRIRTTPGLIGDPDPVSVLRRLVPRLGRRGH